MRTHIVVLRTLNAFFAVLSLGVGATSFGLWTYPLLAEAPADGWMAAMGGLITVVMFGLGAAHVTLALGMGEGRGRGLQTLLAIALLMTFPFGTAYALYALWVCWANPQTRRFMGGDIPVVAPFARV